MEQKEGTLRPDAKIDTLARRCQFILGPRYVESLESWTKLAIHDSLRVTVHPHLTHCSIHRGDKSLTLLGFIVDPGHPEADDSEIVEGLLTKARTGDDLPELTAGLAGRWILIYRDGDDAALFHDALGLRQVVYTDVSSTKDLWCASQPELLAETLGLRISESAKDFIDSYELRKNDERWWPGESTPYSEVKRLLPNHTLSLTTGTTRRYWPDAELPLLTLERARDEIAPVLEGLMRSASHRFDTAAVSLTAGWDSRLILAASRDVKNELTFMTVRQLKMSDDHPDLYIPSRLASSLELEYRIVKSAVLADPEFLRQYKMNAPLAHDVWAPDAKAILDCYGLSKVAISGSGGEIGRCFYRRPSLDRKTLSGKRLSSLAHMGAHPFSVGWLEKWLAGARSSYNVDILDLFYWEQRAGSWMAMAQLEFGMVWKEIFTPYNCRLVLSTMLCVDGKHRRGPAYKLFDELLKALWPEVLREPINPHTNGRPTRRGRVKKLARNIVQRTRWLIGTAT